MFNQKLRSILMFVIWSTFFAGCGYSTSQSRVVSTPNGMQVRESGQCVGFGCGASAAYGYGGMWTRGGIAPYPYSPALARFGAIEAYRARNAWVRGNAPAPAGGGAAQVPGSSGGEARDSRIDRLVPYVRHMANAMCNNHLLESEDCAPPSRMSRQPPAVQPAEASRHERRRTITADELE